MAALHGVVKTAEEQREALAAELAAEAEAELQVYDRDDAIII